MLDLLKVFYFSLLLSDNFKNISLLYLDNKNDMESPCSSEGKNEWKNDPEYNRKWPKGQTSSSSRDVSPWDEDTQEYRRRPYSAEKNHHVRHTRRMNSCEDDFE